MQQGDTATKNLEGCCHSSISSSATAAATSNLVTHGNTVKACVVSVNGNESVLRSDATPKQILVCNHNKSPDKQCKHCWKAFTHAIKSVMHSNLPQNCEVYISINKPEGMTILPLCRVSHLSVIVCRLGRRPNKCKQQRTLAEPERHSGMCAELFDSSGTSNTGSNLSPQPTTKPGDNPPTTKPPIVKVENTEATSDSSTASRDKSIESWWMHCATTYHKQELIASNIFLHGGSICSRLWTLPTEHEIDNIILPPRCQEGTPVLKNTLSPSTRSNTPFSSDTSSSTSPLSNGTPPMLDTRKSNHSSPGTSSSEDEKISAPSPKRACISLPPSSERTTLARAILQQPGVQVFWNTSHDKTVVVACWNDPNASDSSPSPQCTASSCVTLAQASPGPTAGPGGPSLHSLLHTALQNIHSGQMSHATYALRTALCLSPRCIPAFAILNWCWWTRPEIMGDGVAASIGVIGPGGRPICSNATIDTGLQPYGSSKELTQASTSRNVVFDVPSNDATIELLRKAPTAEQDAAESFFLQHCDFPAARALLATFTLYVRRDSHKATQLWASAASQHCAPAQRALAVRHLRGDGAGVCGCDPQEGIRLLKSACLRGDAPAHGWLGHCYEVGIGVAQSWKKAAKYYRIASEKGDFESQCSLAWLYERGLGVHSNFMKAVNWYTLSATLGFADAQRRLAWLQWVGIGTLRDRTQALKNLLKAAKQGHAQSLTELQLWLLSLKGKLFPPISPQPLEYNLQLNSCDFSTRPMPNLNPLPKQFSFPPSSQPLQHYTSNNPSTCGFAFSEPRATPFIQVQQQVQQPVSFNHDIPPHNTPFAYTPTPQFQTFTPNVSPQMPTSPSAMCSPTMIQSSFPTLTVSLQSIPNFNPASCQTQLHVLHVFPTFSNEISAEVIQQAEDWITESVNNPSIRAILALRQNDLARRYFWSKDNDPPII
ncbi:sel1 repeat family protein [Pelomyxa schiedti]|nr:sel1 repeat family protein [Pelomyxa schiedti]